MQSIATKIAEKKMKSEMKKMQGQIVPEGEKPPRRGESRIRAGGDDEGCCAKCCHFICLGSVWTRLLCWATIALIIATLVLWLGGAFLVGPAKTTTSTNVCGVNLTVPLLNKDVYVFYLGTSGTIVLIMIFASCICCCSYFTLCSSEAPDFKFCKICGCIGCFISLLATSVFVGWVALGTFFVINIHGTGPVCRNTVMYMVLLYVYLLVVVLMMSVVLAARCNDWRKGKGRGLDVERLRRPLLRKRVSKDES